MRIKHTGPSLIDLDMTFAKPTANIVLVVWWWLGISQFHTQPIIPVPNKQFDQLRNPLKYRSMAASVASLA